MANASTDIPKKPISGTAPLISFIVPVYNAEHTLIDCLDSIIHQTEQDHEVIAVDDGSSDGSWLLMESYRLSHPDRIRIFQKDNSGPGASRNVGIRNAKGSYLAFADADDRLNPDYVKTVKASILKHDPDLLLIGYDRIYHKKKGIIESIYRFDRTPVYRSPTNISQHPDLIGKAEVALWLRIIRKNLVIDHQVFIPEDLMVGEDLVTSLNWYLTATRICVLKDQLYQYSMSSHTLSLDLRHMGDYSTAIEYIVSGYKAAGKFELFRKELEYILSKHLILSNLVRLRFHKKKGSYERFMDLRKNLMTHFPNFSKNPYLKSEPFYVRMALQITQLMPGFLRIFLK